MRMGGTKLALCAEAQLPLTHKILKNLCNLCNLWIPFPFREGVMGTTQLFISPE
jgi:hypothetical protein